MTRFKFSLLIFNFLALPVNANSSQHLNRLAQYFCRSQNLPFAIREGDPVDGAVIGITNAEVRLLGEGGQGIVYRVIPNEPGVPPYIIKTLKSRFAGDEALRQVNQLTEYRQHLINVGGDLEFHYVVPIKDGEKRLRFRDVRGKNLQDAVIESNADDAAFLRNLYWDRVRALEERFKRHPDYKDVRIMDSTFAHKESHLPQYLILEMLDKNGDKLRLSISPLNIIIDPRTLRMQIMDPS